MLERNQRCVIATGGSIVSEPGTYDLLLSTCYTVWLKAEPEEHMARVVAQGDTRPMAGNTEAMDDLRRILAGRGALYRQADTVVDTAGRSVEQSLKELKRVRARLRARDEQDEQMSIDYSERIPNNVNLANDRTLQRALEHWQPKFLDWWQEMGPHDFAARGRLPAHRRRRGRAGLGELWRR